MKTNVNLYVEYLGKKTSTKAIEDMTKEIWKSQGGKVKDIVSLDIYYKPEEGKCYYVINETETGSFAVEAE